jgi:hypothetical protein
VSAEVVAPVLTFTTDHVEAFSQTVATAFCTFEASVNKATRTQMETVAEACADLRTACGNLTLTASVYERVLGKALKAELSVRVKRGKLAEGTASKKASQMKSVALALVNNALTPDEGEGFASVYERSVKALADPTFAHVFDAPKQGAPAGTASAKKGTGRKALGSKPGGASGGPTASPQAAASKDAVEHATEAAEAAAAKIFAGGDNVVAMRLYQRRAKVLAILANHIELFDKWAEGVEPTDQPTVKAPASKGSKVAAT